MMRIGLDIDNVISAFDELLLEEFLLEDKNKRNKGIINPNAKHIVNGMFDWTEEEIEEFMANNVERIAKKLKLIDNAKFYIDKLLEEGNEIYLITNRTKPHYKNPEDVTVNWLKQMGINYTKLIFSETRDKSNYCIENKIDFFVDDMVGNCMKLESNGIKCFLFETKYNAGQTKIKNVIKDWEDLYRKVGEMEKCTKRILY